MALIQMPQCNNEDYNELNDRIAELEEKLQKAEKKLTVAYEERNIAAAKVQEAIKLVSQRDTAIRNVEEQVKQLHSLAKILQKENTEYKAANQALNKSLSEKQKDLQALQQEKKRMASQNDILAKLEALEVSLNETMVTIHEDEKAGFDVVSKKIGLMNDSGFQMKVLSTLNSVEQNTSKLRNYNDSKCMSEIDRLSRKVDHIDKLVNDNRFIGLLCIGSIGIGIMLAKLLL